MRSVLLFLCITLSVTPAFACHAGDLVDKNYDNVWIVSCHSTKTADYMLDSNGKVHVDDTKVFKLLAAQVKGTPMEKLPLTPTITLQEIPRRPDYGHPQ